MSTQIKATGVPEYFNSVWREAIENGAFAKEGLDVSWREESLGTGAMCKSLSAGEVDVAVLLTEGAIADIIKCGNHRIVGIFVNSPLNWGIHVPATSTITEPTMLRGKTFGISRYGSGSHLMASVFATQHKWDSSRDISFAEIGDLTNARAALGSGKADVFLWEKFTTQFVVDQGEWKCIGEHPTPWPAFVVTVRTEFLEQHPTAIATMMRVLKETGRELSRTIEHAKIESEVCSRYNLTPLRYQAALKSVVWSCELSVPEQTLRQVVTCLGESGILSAQQVTDFTPQSVISALTLLTTEDSSKPSTITNVMYQWRVQSIYNALKSRGKSMTDALTVEDLTSLGHLDQYHYLGTRACDECANILGLQPSRRVLDVGSGIGGPARYLAQKTGCHVTGVEIQNELVEAARDLTSRCQNVRDLVEYICNDITQIDVPEQSFDHFISMLVFLHIPERPRLFDRCFNALKPGGTFLIEDFFQLQ
eukprot:c9270_g1_i2.p1 GENE.c9270_g1_i2~~c9270_g1_i2.p1  ORF type:complete len:479 (+),score=142.21 c9270_g1_i2:56-1492(+)